MYDKHRYSQTCLSPLNYAMRKSCDFKNCYLHHITLQTVQYARQHITVVLCVSNSKVHTMQTVMLATSIAISVVECPSLLVSDTIEPC